MLIIAKHPIQHPQHPSPIGHHYVQPHPGGSVTNNNRF